MALPADDDTVHGPREKASTEASFDVFAGLVQRVLSVPTALASLIEVDRQVLPGAVGLPEPYQTARETPLTHSFCQYVVAHREPLVIADARLEPRLTGSVAIRDLGVVAYAGWPLTDHTGTMTARSARSTPSRGLGPPPSSGTSPTSPRRARRSSRKAAWPRSVLRWSTSCAAATSS